jgi:hypothetical protein
MADKLRQISSTIGGVFGIDDDWVSKESNDEGKSAFVEMQSPKQTAKVMKDPSQSEIVYLGDKVNVVFDIKDMPSCMTSATLKLMTSGTFGKSIYGEWPLSKKMLEDASIDSAHSVKDPSGQCDGSDASKMCKYFTVDMVSNKDYKKLGPVDGLFFQLVCPEQMSKHEPTFNLKNTVRPVQSKCLSTLMVTFGLFPFKFPVGVEADMLKVRSELLYRRHWGTIVCWLLFC